MEEHKLYVDFDKISVVCMGLFTSILIRVNAIYLILTYLYYVRVRVIPFKYPVSSSVVSCFPSSSKTLRSDPPSFDGAFSARLRLPLVDLLSLLLHRTHSLIGALSPVLMV